MAPFIAQCPECRTAFRISHGQLRAAEGYVRCGACLQVFSARDHRVLLDTDENPAPATEASEFVGPPLPPELAETVELTTELATENDAADEEGSAAAAGLDPPFVIKQEAAASLRAEARECLATLRDEDALETLGAGALEAIEEDPLEFGAGEARRPRRTLLLGLANLALLLMLGAQYVWANYETLAADARFRPALAWLCDRAGCASPPLRDLDAIRSQQLMVHSHPTVPGALQVDFIFRNDAGFPQRFPLVELNFLDSRNRLLASRRFKPGEYLPPELRQFENMPPASPVQVSLEIVDPGPEAVNYSLAFRFP